MTVSKAELIKMEATLRKQELGEERGNTNLSFDALSQTKINSRLTLDFRVTDYFPKSDNMKLNSFINIVLVFVFMTACAFANAQVLSNTIASGSWANPAIWDNGVPGTPTDTAIVNHDVTADANITVGFLTVNAGATLDKGAAGGLFVAAKDVVIDGTVSNFNVAFRPGSFGVGFPFDLSGTGQFIDCAVDFLRPINILAGSDLTFSGGNIDVFGAITVANSGTVSTVNGCEMDGNDAASTFQNTTAASVFNIGDTVFATLGTIDATTVGNTVSYNGTVGQTILGVDYHHLILDSTLNKSLEANTTVAGDLTIQEMAILNSANFNLDVAGNWTNISGAADSFLEGTGTVTFNGTGAQTINVSSRETFNDLVLNNVGGALNLSNGPIEISGSATLTDGILTCLASNSVTFADNATSTSGSLASYIDGAVTKVGDDAFVFPVGDGGFWARIEIFDGPFNTSTEFTAEYFRAAAVPASIGCCREDTVNNVSGVEYWTLDLDTWPTADSCKVRLYSEETDAPHPNSSGINLLSELMVVRYDTANAQWEGEGTGNTTGVLPDNVTAETTNRIQRFSPFTFGSPGWAFNPLPVELTYFDVEEVEQKANLVWETESEVNNDYFEVQRSTDGFKFERLGIVEGSGTTSFSNSYNFVDENPYRGVSYYRLKQVDFDGQYEYTDTKSFELYAHSNILLAPNPVSSFDQLTVDVSQFGFDAEEVTVKLVMADGRIVYAGGLQQNGKLNFGQNLEQTARGIYMLSVYANDQLIGTEQLIKTGNF